MTRTVLIAEDNADVRYLLQYKLQANGYDVVEVEDGRACLDYLREASALPAAVILDIMMPRVSGLEVLDRIRDDESLSSLPVLLLTSKSSEEDVVRGLEQGASDYLTKPFSADEVLTRIERIIESP
ncbi:response regulator transcription factor [Halosolutus gelatinilyticus]|uniref:response regulator transcription factor n=1 Tax=Halosolutus gelatinilyticus TaxID=2931975 RepID=UPI001FF5EA06|nr:response regulator [Halosolutus gelatinilyticus]